MSLSRRPHAPRALLLLSGAKLWPTVAAAAGVASLGAGGVAAVALDHGSPAAEVSASPLLSLPVPAALVLPTLQDDAPPIVPVTAATSPAQAVTASLPVRAASPSPRRTAPAPAPAAAPAGHPNFLTSDDGTLNANVGTYSDCSGQSALGSDAAILSCITGRLYFVGHNLGVFTPLMHMGVGSGITYYDAGGTAHHYRVIGVRDNWVRANGPPPVLQPNVVAQFQTCETPDATTDRILDAVGDPPDPVTPVVAAAAQPVAATAAPVVTTATTTAKPITGTIWSLLFSR